MKIIFQLMIASILVTFSFTGHCLADYVDLSLWTAVSLDLPGGQSVSNWNLSDSNTTATQTINADPSFFLNNLNQSNYTMEGSWRVITSADDDFIGFTFGYQDSSHFYIMDWKQAYQNTSGYGIAQEGFSIKKISAPSFSDLTIKDLWQSTGTINSTILASNFGSDKGWSEFADYDFYLEFEPGHFLIIVSEGEIELWNIVVNDTSYSSGQFGFYNYSQGNVEYSGFEQGCIYIPGDANGSGSTNGLDVIFMVNWFKFWPPSQPPDSCYCPPHDWIYSAADANGNCSFNGLDVVYLVNYLKGTGPAPVGCEDCLIE